MAEHTVEIHHTFTSTNGSEVFIVISQAEGTIEVHYKLRGGDQPAAGVKIDRQTLSELAELFGEADKFLEPGAAHDTPSHPLPQEEA